MRTNTAFFALLAGLLLTALGTHDAEAAVTVYTDRAAWRAAAGGGVGRIVDDFGAGSLGDRGPYALERARGDATLTFDQPIRALGFDLKTGVNLDPRSMLVRIDGGNPLDFDSPLDDASKFRGFISDVPFSRFAFSSARTEGSIFGIDNLEADPSLACPPTELGDTLRIQKSAGSTVLNWSDPNPANSYVVYRGSMVTGRDWVYDHACLVTVTSPGVADNVVPRAGTGFYYFVSRVEQSCESVLGQDSDGAAVPNSNACPPADSDGDGHIDVLDDCPADFDPAQSNHDNDPAGDACDNCPDLGNPWQQDLDDDGLGDACDQDVDDDGIQDALDNCPTVPNGAQIDTDEDGTGDACECLGVECVPADACHLSGSCNSATGACSNPVAPDDTACNDGNPCTQSDLCQTGACIGGSPVVCTPSDSCHVAGTCDPSTGVCSNPVGANGSACTDGNQCTVGETCQGGQCQGGNPLLCDDDNGCTSDSCNPMSGCVHSSNGACQTTFGPGTLIIPMDTIAQDRGMLRAYGLVYALLRANVPVRWVISPTKTPGGNDFTFSGPAGSMRNFETGATVSVTGYRGGPFVIASGDAAAAGPIISAWLAPASDTTVVHRLTSDSFQAPVSRILIAAPRVAVLKDGDEAIAFNDLNAAGILDSVGGTWTPTSPDLLTEDAVDGASNSDHDDGVLFHLPSGLPRYCHLTSMHYNTTSRTPEVVQEVRRWLDHGPLTHGFMQCDSTRVFENQSPGGFFLTTAGLQDEGTPPEGVTVRVPSHPLAQVDGPLAIDTGAVDSFRAITPGTFKTGVTTLINETEFALTRRVVLLTGRLDGDGSNGRVTYLGGHDYSVNLPISSNPQTNGVRFLLNSLFESDCATTPGQSDVTVMKSAPAFINTSQITYTIQLTNPADAVRPAENLRLTDRLPMGTTFVSATGGGTHASDVVTWNLSPLAPGASTSVSVTVSVTSDGTYENTARLSFSTLAVRTSVSNTTTTVRDTVAPVVTITAGPSGVTNDRKPEFSFSVTGSPAIIECGYDGAHFVPCSPPTYRTPTLLDGPHTFDVRATDSAGNQGAASRAFTVDTDPPHVDFAGPSVDPVHSNNSPPEPIHFTASSGAVATYCGLGGPPFDPCVSPFARPATEGVYTLSVYAVDEAGNQGPVASYFFTVDVTAPTLMITSPPTPPDPSLFATHTPSFGFQVSSGISPTTTTCRIDGGMPIACIHTLSVPLPGLSDGTHSLVITSSDEAGNIGMPVHRSFIVDTTAPVVDIDGAPGNPPATWDSTPMLRFHYTSDGRPVTGTCRVYLAAPPHATVSSGPCQFPTSTDGFYQVSSDLSDGNYVFEARVIDAAGNVGTEDHAFSFTVDTIAPQVEIFPPPINPVYTRDTTPTFLFFVSSGGSPTATECRVVAPSGPDPDPPFEPCMSPFTVTQPLNDDSYFLEVRATDLANLSGADIHQFHVDNAGPVVAITDLPGPTADNTPSFTVTFTEDGSTNNAFCRVDGMGELTPCGTTVMSPATVTVSPALTDGAHTLTVRVVDAAGNAGEDVTNFIVDTTPPVVTIDDDVTTSNDDTPSFLFFVFDLNLNPAATVCRILDDSSVLQVLSNCTSPFTSAPLDADGVYFVQVEATDSAGNTDTATQDFTLDTAPPTVVITAGPSGPTHDTTPTFAFSTEDSPDSPTTTVCWIDSNPEVDCIGQFTTLSALSEGMHTFHVRVTDEAGNSASAHRTFTVDTTPPDTAIVTRPPNPTNGITGHFEFASEGGATFECRLDLGAFALCPQTYFTPALTDGSHTLEVRATDAAGNPDPTPASYTWVIDTNGPVAVITSAPQDWSNDPAPTFELTSEAGATFECQIDGTPVPCAASFTVEPLMDGTHTIQVRAVDTLGNTGPDASYTWDIDTVAPNTSVSTTEPSPTDAVVEFTLTASEPATFECSLDDAAFAVCSSPYTTPALADGPHALAVRAIDEAGNVDPTPATHTWTVETP